MRKLYFPIKGDLHLHLYEEIEIYGMIFAGRDAVLPKLVRLFEENKLVDYGIDLAGSLIFHTAVSPAGIGPTSSNKLEIESSIPPLSLAGVKIHLGKGALGRKTVEALQQNHSFFAVTPPVSALFANKLRSSQVVAFEEEGIEAFYRLEVDGIPGIIAAANGESLLKIDGDESVIFKLEQVTQVVAETLVRASTSFRADQLERYNTALQEEKNQQACWVMERILENAEIGENHRLPLCDDTGIPHVFLEIGDDAALPAGFFAAIDDGIASGLRVLPGRPMAVKGDDVQRITQSAGLYDRSDKLLPAPVQIRRLPGDLIKLTILMLGGGPEIRGKTQRVFHQHTLDVVINEMVAWALEGASKLGCLPCVLFYGIGRTNVEAASLALEAMKDCDFLQQSEMEQRITAEVNRSNIGPLGIGGQTTALATFVKVGQQRASGVRVVSLRVGCCIDPRKATYVWRE